MTKFNIIRFDTIDSTNEEASRLIDQGLAEEWSVILAGFQESGKGLDRNTWESDAGKNLLFTLILQPAFLPPENQFLLNMIVSLGIIEGLETVISDPVMIKWPNDIYVENLKLGGILIRNFVQGRKIRYSIAGVGLNVNQRSFPSHLPNPVSVIQRTGRESVIEELLAGILASIKRRYELVRKNGPGDLEDEYLNRLYKYRELSDYKIKGSVVRGSVAGIDEFGRLLINVKGENFACDLKEVEYL